MNQKISVNDILTNIYGIGTQQHIAKQFSNTNVRYLDEEYKEPSQVEHHEEEPIAPKSLKGGVKIKPVDEVIYASADYISDKDLQEFLDGCYLHFVVNFPNSKAIFVVPSASTIKDLSNEVATKLKSEKLEPGSMEASKYISKTPLTFKRYIFDVFGDYNTKENYTIPAEFPSKGSKDIYIRTNRLMQKYYFKFSSKDKIEISQNEDMKKPTQLEFLARCSNNVIILKGDLPDFTGVVKTNVSKLGKASKNNRKNKFIKKIKKTGDINKASYEFVAEVAKDNFDEVVNKYSGNMIYTAISLINDKPTYKTNLSKKEMKDIHERLLDSYKPLARKVRIEDMNRYTKKLGKELFGKNEQYGKIGTKLRNLYNSIKLNDDDLKADMTYGVYQNALSYGDDQVEAIETGLDLADDIVNNRSLNYGKAKNAFNILESRPLLGVTFKSQCPMIGGYFEDNVKEMKDSCSDCSDCSGDCSDCSDHSDCSDCSDCSDPDCSKTNFIDELKNKYSKKDKVKKDKVKKDKVKKDKVKKHGSDCMCSKCRNSKSDSDSDNESENESDELLAFI